MNILTTPIQDLLILQKKAFSDERGIFYKYFDRIVQEKSGIFFQTIEDALVTTYRRGTLRGLHYQQKEFAQAKLVSCVRGEILDVAVDLRPASPTYKKWHAVVLQENDARLFLIPRGFAHGYLTRTDQTIVAYKMDNAFSPESERTIRWNDPTLAIDWGIEEPILSEKDRSAPLFQE